MFELSIAHNQNNIAIQKICQLEIKGRKFLKVINTHECKQWKYTYIYTSASEVSYVKMYSNKI